MSIEELAFDSTSDHIQEWLDGLSSYIPPMYDDPYNSGGFNDEPWWLPCLNFDQELISRSPTPTPASTSIISEHQDHFSSDLSKKRKASDDSFPKEPETHLENQNQWISEVDDANAIRKQRAPPRKSAKNKNSKDKDRMWAEQLLNPCAAAVTAANLSRVQHFLYVLRELASPTGDANHRLAYHGFQAMKHHLSSPNSASLSSNSTTSASAKPKFFKDSLINFNDMNPWFHIPNSIANSSIIQIVKEQGCPCNLHILDIGVSHGVQWPTLLSELTCQPCGPPPLVRLTVVNPSGATPFATCPPGYNFSTQLLGFAKTMNINLQINILDNYPLQNLDSEVINFSPDETLIVCAQFRLHNLNHTVPDDRTQFLKFLRSMNPKGVIVSENNIDCSCNNCCDFARAFSRRVDYLWRFLDSTSVAYKGRDNDERRMMEGEAAEVLTYTSEMNERKEEWCKRMRSVGFTRGVFGEDTIDGARVLLKKYDTNWEMKVEEKKDEGCVSLSWKGEPVSFCSIWNTDPQAIST